MGVYIRGMAMPSGCGKCHYLDMKWNGAKCHAKSRQGRELSRMYNLDDYRPDWCPLVEVEAPHGDLIDRDKLIEDIANQGPYIIDDLDAQSYTNGLGAAKVSADLAPVVIKAEGV